MAGWTDSGGSRGRGGGGGGFANRGGANANNNTVWRERRPPQTQPQPPPQQQQHHHQQHHQQQHHRYRPVNDNGHSSQHPRHPPPAEELDRHQGQGGSSTSTRRPRPTRPPQPRPTLADHKPSPNPSTPSAIEPDDKARRNAANFECNVCFDMADDPVVTKCGHLFCWDCLYQWLHVHSNHRECPVCKGQVADDAIIPIYGRGGSAASVHAAPPRPTGARVESSRQQQLQQAAAANLNMMMIDEDDEDENNSPFLHEISFGINSLRHAVIRSIISDDDIEQDYDDYTNPYLHNFDEVYGSDFMPLPIFRSADAAEAVIGSSRRHGHHSVFSDDIMDTFFDNTTHQEPDFGYRGGRRQRGRARGTTSADHLNDHIVGMVLGSSLRIDDNSGASYRDTGAGPHHINNSGGSSRPNGGFTERRGRSNRNSNSGGGRGTQNSRRQGANYN